MFEFVRQVSTVDLYKFNDMTDFDIEVAPAVVWDELRVFNEDFFDGKMKLEQNLEKKHFIIEVPDEDLKVKVKFIDLNVVEEDDDEDEPRRVRVRFTKKRGDTPTWYNILNEMKEANFSEILLAPENHHDEIILS